MWSEYMRRTGSLNLGKRIEQAVATMCLTLVRVHGNKRAKIADFLPDREPKVATLQEVFAMFKTAAKASADAAKAQPARQVKRAKGQKLGNS